jgi:hypothetical protein
MGREAIDGTFSDFQNKTLGLRLNFQDLAVQMTSLRGEDLLFGWQGPLRCGMSSRFGFNTSDPYCAADLYAEHGCQLW